MQPSEDFITACHLIHARLVHIREQVKDEAALKLIDGLLDEIYRMRITEGVKAIAPISD